MEWLNYHHLLYFWTVAREGTIARAAEKLLLAQPTISGQIKALEASLGQPLFERRGRKLALTETGEMVYGYANEIFSVGRELMTAVRQHGADRPLRFHVGVTDSIPKLVVHEMLRPAFNVERPLQLTCHEGKLPALLSDLAIHQLDVVLADRPGDENTAVKSFSHRLGESQTLVMAAAELARSLKPRFPESLNDAPALLPTAGFALRRRLDRWFAKTGVTPRIVAEIEDSALTKVFAAEGRGFIAVPQVMADLVRKRYGLRVVGPAEGCDERFYAVTVERRLKHPAVLAISDAARSSLFA